MALSTFHLVQLNQCVLRLSLPVDVLILSRKRVASQVNELNAPGSYNSLYLAEIAKVKGLISKTISKAVLSQNI